MKAAITIYTLIIWCIPFQIFGQDSSLTSKTNLGVRLSVFYNYKVIHYVPTLSLDLGQHNVYLGVQSTNVLNPMASETTIYEKSSFGANFGYRYLFVNKQNKVVPFAQLNFSLYELNYVEYQRGPFSQEKQQLILENTASIGLNFNVLKKVQFSCGIGFGSFEGFFLLVDSFIPTGYVGVEYKF